MYHDEKQHKASSGLDTIKNMLAFFPDGLELGPELCENVCVGGTYLMCPLNGDTREAARGIKYI